MHKYTLSTQLEDEVVVSIINSSYLNKDNNYYLLKNNENFVELEDLLLSPIDYFIINIYNENLIGGYAKCSIYLKNNKICLKCLNPSITIIDNKFFFN